MSLSYDQLVQKMLDDGKAVSKSEAKRVVTLQEARKMREREGYTINGTSNSIKMTVTGIPVIVPKRRGRPPGVKNKPKDAKPKP